MDCTCQIYYSHVKNSQFPCAKEMLILETAGCEETCFQNNNASFGRTLFYSVTISIVILKNINANFCMQFESLVQ